MPPVEPQITLNDPLPPEAQLELARIHDATKVVRSRSKVQATAIAVVGLITAALVVGSVMLTLNNKEVPSFFGTTISLFAAGLVGSLAYEAGKNNQGGGTERPQP